MKVVDAIASAAYESHLFSAVQLIVVWSEVSQQLFYIGKRVHVREDLGPIFGCCVLDLWVALCRFIHASRPTPKPPNGRLLRSFACRYRFRRVLRAKLVKENSLFQSLDFYASRLKRGGGGYNRLIRLRSFVEDLNPSVLLGQILPRHTCPKPDNLSVVQTHRSI